MPFGMEGGVTILLLVLATLVAGGIGLLLYLSGEVLLSRDEELLHTSERRRMVKPSEAVEVAGTGDSYAARAARRIEREAKRRAREVDLLPSEAEFREREAELREREPQQTA